jgi:hypothetical protein
MDEYLQFQPLQTGTYYVRVHGYTGSSRTIPYSLHLAFNGSVPAGTIHGVVRNNQQALGGVVIGLYYWDGYRSYRTTTLTNSSGAYSFRGMQSLPVNHYYYVSYFNQERVSERLGSWYCWSFRSYQAGTTHHACDFDVAGIALLAPAHDGTVGLPATFSWQSRGLTGDQYAVSLQRDASPYAWFGSPYTTGSSYVLGSLPSGFAYGSRNLWNVDVMRETGRGYSYYFRYVTFSSALGLTADPSGELLPLHEVCGQKDAPYPEICDPNPVPSGGPALEGR